MHKKRVVIVYFLEKKEVGFEFTKWPNHITFVPYFNTIDLNKLEKDLRTLCKKFNKIPFTVGEEDLFGVKTKLKVSKVNNYDTLQKFHEEILKISLSHDEKMGVLFCGTNFKPHITHNNIPYPKTGDAGIIDNIYLVENLHKKINGKKIIKIIKLND